MFVIFHIHAGSFMFLSHHLELCLMLLVNLFWLFKVACIKESLPDEQYHWSSLNTSSNYLFKNKGSTVRNKPGCLFQRTDFATPYFRDDDFMTYNKFGEGHTVVFPIYMYSHLKFTRQNYDSWTSSSLWFHRNSFT